MDDDEVLDMSYCGYYYILHCRIAPGTLQIFRLSAEENLANAMKCSGAFPFASM